MTRHTDTAFAPAPVASLPPQQAAPLPRPDFVDTLPSFFRSEAFAEDLEDGHAGDGADAAPAAGALRLSTSARRGWLSVRAQLAALTRGLGRA